MKSQLAPSFFALTLLIAFTTLTLPSSDAFDDVQFKQRAVSQWIGKVFLDVYTTHLTPHPDDVKEGEETYNSLKDPGFESKALSGVLVDMKADSAKQMVDIWEKKDLVLKSQADHIKEMLADESWSKTVRQTVKEQPSNQIAYGIIGIVRVSPDTFTVPYSFSKVKFNTAPNVEMSLSEEHRMWGIYCPSAFSVKDIESSKASQMFEFLRDKAIREFSEQNPQHIQYIDYQANRYQIFLPTETNEKVQQLYDASNKDKTWDSILTEDPLQGDKIYPKSSSEE